MTPQQRLQEAKDQCAKTMGFIGWSDMRAHVKEDHIAELMYEAGKKEGEYLQTSEQIETHRRGVDAGVSLYKPLYEKAIEEAKTFRKALEEIDNVFKRDDDDYKGLKQWLDQIQHLTQEALKP